MKRFISAIALSALALGSACAAAIPGLYNTGAGAPGSVDQNYSLMVLAGDTSSDRAYISQDSQVRGEWLTNDATSKWITPTNFASASLDPTTAGEYIYSLAFNLTTEQAAGASFQARYAGDNEVSVYLNGRLISGASSFGSWTDFGANSGFLAGGNGLQFIVTNFAQASGNPTGLRVEFLNSFVPGAVPEPETYAMMLGGLALLGVVARRRQRT
jgi:hypothetical protein